MKADERDMATRFKIMAGIIFFAVLTRMAVPPFLGHVPNFSPIDAIALLSGACLGRRLSAFVLVFLCVWTGDLLLNKMNMGHWQLFYAGCFWQYAAWFLITLIGSGLKDKVNPARLLSATLASSLLFFAISNFGVWCGGWLYPMTVEGLGHCYAAAIPFYKNTLLSDLFFSGVLFGLFEWIQSRLRQLPQARI